MLDRESHRAILKDEEPNQRLEEDTVAVTKMELMELVRNAEDGDVDFLREGVRVLAQALMEAEVSDQAGLRLTSPQRLRRKTTQGWEA